MTLTIPIKVTLNYSSAELSISSFENSITFAESQCIDGNIGSAAEKIIAAFTALDNLHKVHLNYTYEESKKKLHDFEIILVARDAVEFLSCGFRASSIFKEIFPGLIPPDEFEKCQQEYANLLELAQTSYAEALKKALELNGAIEFQEDGFPVDMFFTPFNEFKRRIKKEERKNLNELLVSLPLLNAEDVEALQKGRWQSEVFKRPNWPLMVFQALQSDQLTINQASKLYLYEACLISSDSRYPAETFQIFDEKGDIDNLSLKMLKKSVKGYLNEAEFLKFCIALKQLPAEASQFFAITPTELDHRVVTEEDIDKGYLPTTLLNLLYHFNRFQLFIVKVTDNRYLQLIVPPQLCYEVMKIKFGPHAMKPYPVLGFFQKERLSYPDKRVVNIPSSFCASPPKIHYFSTTPLTVYHHDATYHLFLESGNIHRAAWIELAEVFKLAKLTESQVLTLDREFPLYSRPEVAKKFVDQPIKNSCDCFWLSLEMLYQRICFDVKVESIHFISLTVEHILNHQERWKKDYGIDLASLEACFKQYKMIEPFDLKPWVDYYKKICKG